MNFLLGGRMGDLIHALYVVKNTPGKHTLFVTDRRDLHSDGFILPLEETVNELKPILNIQPWVHRVVEHDGAIIHQNLSLWRRYAYSASWTQLLANTFGVPTNGEPWIVMDKLPVFKNLIVIHKSIPEARRGHQWDLIMDKYAGQCIFVGSDEERAAFKYNIPHIKPESLYEFFQIIASCKFFIGNQSAPLAMAHSLGVPRLAMLNEVDKAHYVGEEKWHKNFYWIADGTHYFEGLDY